MDKFLWAVRIYKTRSLATEACRSGHVKLDGATIKPAREVQVGDLIQAKTAGLTRTIKVRALTQNRVGAAVVGEWIDELTPDEERGRRQEARKSGFVPRAKGMGRPTKKDRRAIQKYL